jgi:hypothetical protein
MVHWTIAFAFGKPFLTVYPGAVYFSVKRGMISTKLQGR